MFSIRNATWNTIFNCSDQWIFICLGPKSMATATTEFFWVIKQFDCYVSQQHSKPILENLL